MEFKFDLNQSVTRITDGAVFRITQRRERVHCQEPEYCNCHGSWCKESELRPTPVAPLHVKDVKIESDMVFYIPRAMGQSALRERSVGLSDFITNYLNVKDTPQTPVDKCNQAVREVLDNRGAQYTPKEGRSQIQAEMNDAVMAALKPLLPDGLPLGAQFILTQIAGKFTRAVEQACNGTYSGDNTLDFGGYSACLAAKVAKAKHPKEVVK